MNFKLKATLAEPDRGPYGETYPEGTKRRAFFVENEDGSTKVDLFIYFTPDGKKFFSFITPNMSDTFFAYSADEMETLEEIAKKGKPFYTVPKGMSVADFIREQYKESLYKTEIIEGLVERYKDIVPTEDGRIPMIDVFGHEDVFSFQNFVPQQTDDPRYQNGKEHACATVFNWYDWNIDHEVGCKRDQAFLGRRRSRNQLRHGMGRAA